MECLGLYQDFRLERPCAAFRESECLRGEGFQRREDRLLISIPVFQGLAGLVIGLFILQVIRRLTAGSSNQLAAGVSDGIEFLVS